MRSPGKASAKVILKKTVRQWESKPCRNLEGEHSSRVKSHSEVQMVGVCLSSQGAVRRPVQLEWSEQAGGGEAAEVSGARSGWVGGGVVCRS